MTRNIGPRFPDLLDEIVRTLESLLVGAEKGMHKYGPPLEHPLRLSQRLGGYPCL